MAQFILFNGKLLNINTIAKIERVAEGNEFKLNAVCASGVEFEGYKDLDSINKRFKALRSMLQMSTLDY